MGTDYPRITHFWSDEDTVFAAYFEDGWVVAATEHKVVTIDETGAIVGSWWKEEPDDPHYQKYVTDIESLPTTQPVDEEMVELIFQVGHEAGHQLRSLIAERISD